MKKFKKCTICKKDFKQFQSTQKVCSPTCAITYANEKNVKEFDKETKRLKKKLKTRSDWLREAQREFNRFIRLRDSGKPCISCDKPDNGQHQRHASHYRSVAACSQLRFNTFNVHASCATCNSILSGNLIEYRIRLKLKLGVSRVKWLESQNNITRYEIDYLIRMKKIFSIRSKLILNRL